MSVCCVYLAASSLRRYPKETLILQRYAIGALVLGTLAAMLHQGYRRLKRADHTTDPVCYALASVLTLAALVFPSTWFHRSLPNLGLDWYVLTISLGAALALLVPRNIPVSPTLGRTALVATLALAVLAYVTYGLMNHWQFHTVGRDLGLFDQITWHYSRFEPPIATEGTIRNLLRMEHFHPALALLAPLYWIHRGAENLIIVEALSVGLGAIPVYLLAEKTLRHPLSAYALAFAYVFFIGLQKGVDYTFHPETLGVCFLSWAIYLMWARKWAAFAIVGALCLGFKETFSVYMALLGAVAILTHRRRVAGVLSILAGTVVLVFYVQFHQAWAGQSYSYPLGGLDGTGPAGVISGILSQPSRYLGLLVDRDEKIKTALVYFSSVGFLNFLSPLSILTLPVLAERYWQDRWGMWVVHWHYGTSMAVPLIYSAMFGLRWWADRVPGSDTRTYRLNRLGCYLLICSCLANFSTVGRRSWLFSGYDSPLSKLARMDYYRSEERVRACHEMLSLIPEDSPIIAQDSLAPHLTTRREVYQPAQAGLDPSGVEYVAMETFRNLWPLSPDEYRAYVNSLLLDPDFGLVFADGDCFLLKRGVPHGEGLRETVTRSLERIG